MFACLQEDVLEFVRFEGIDTDRYPFWFQEMIDRGYVYSEYPGQNMYSSDEGEVALTFGDVFMVNKHGMVRWFSSADFNDKFYECK